MRKICGGYGRYWSIAILSLLLLIGCTACGGNKKETETQGNNGTQQNSTEMKDPVTEAVSEEETEEMEFRSIREVLDEETLAWVDSFDEKKIAKMEYIILDEEESVYTVTDPEKIREFFDALMEVQVAGLAEVFATTAGDSFVFYEDEENSVKFRFHMGCLMVGDEKYETDNTDALWDLTGYLMFPEELGSEE